MKSAYTTVLKFTFALGAIATFVLYSNLGTKNLDGETKRFNDSVNLFNTKGWAVLILDDRKGTEIDSFNCTVYLPMIMPIDSIVELANRIEIGCV